MSPVNNFLTAYLGVLVSLLLLHSVQSLQQCYSCSAIHSPSACSTITTCDADEICGVTTQVVTSGIYARHQYSFGCQNKHTCVESTKKILLFRERFNGVGKRSTMTACNACCGDNLCNNGDCIKLLAFVKSEKPNQFPGLKVKYARGADPEIFLYDEDMENLGMDSMGQFLMERLKR